jgi:hypothetical protein
MNLPLKISAGVAVGSFLLMVASSIVGTALEAKGVVLPSGVTQNVVRAFFFGLFLLFGLSVIPLMVHGVIAVQVRLGNGEVPLVKLLRAHETGIVLAMWAMILLGLLIALPVMLSGLFRAQLKSTGTLIANVGMPLEAVEARSTLKLVPDKRMNHDGSRMTAGGAVFDFEVAGTGLRFERCRYYWIETYEHDNPRLKKLNIGISPQKFPRADLEAVERAVQKQIRADHWVPGQYVYRTEDQRTLHGGATSSGEGKYWAKGGTLLILSSKRVDESKAGEDPKTAGEFILHVDLVPRDDSLYSRLEFAPEAALTLPRAP